MKRLIKITRCMVLLAHFFLSLALMGVLIWEGSTFNAWLIGCLSVGIFARVFPIPNNVSE